MVADSDTGNDARRSAVTTLGRYHSPRTRLAKRAFWLTFSLGALVSVALIAAATSRVAAADASMSSDASLFGVSVVRVQRSLGDEGSTASLRPRPGLAIPLALVPGATAGLVWARAGRSIRRWER